MKSPCYFLLLAVLLNSAMASARWDQNSAQLAEFRARCAHHRRAVTLDRAPEVGATEFFPLGALESAQGRFSFLRALETVERGEGKREDHGAVFGLNKPGLGVVYHGKIYLADGNHKAIASTVLKANTMAVRIIAHWDDLDTPEQFQIGMEKAGWGHWRDFRGEMMPMRDLCELINDPNLQLARLEIRRIDAEPSKNGFKVVHDSGGRRVNALKINHDVPFFEIIYGDTLHQAGEVWDDDLTADDLKRVDVQRHLDVLKRAAAADPDSPLNQMLLLDRPALASELDYQRLVNKHLEKHGCEAYLKP